MLDFLKHHWTRREKLIARMRGEQVLVGVVVGVMLAAGIAVWQVGQDQSRRNELQVEARQAVANQTTEQKNLPPGTQHIGGPFALTDQDGKRVTDADYRGKYLLVYFGYTYCPDMCPTGLQGIAHALNQLGPDVAKVKPLFITIDPARDTPDKMKTYVNNFHPDISGLTGTPEQIATVAKEYQVYYAKGEKVDEDQYMMDHTTLIYLMDAQGGFITTFDEEADPALIVKALREQFAK